MLHVMLDLETWGTEPGCDIRSIGAVVFDPVSGHVGYERSFYQAVDGGEIRGLTRDPKTVEWWESQPEEARGAFTDLVDLHEGLRDFSAWYRSLAHDTAEVTLWCNGPHFDEVILKACYKACNLPHPWHYRAPRDFRTIMELADWPEVERVGTYHNALDDAITQALGVIEAYRILKG